MPGFQEPRHLKIKCTTVDCDSDLHCFKHLKKMTEEERGKCRYRGANLVDRVRLHTRNSGDVEYTFAALKNELIRHYFSHCEPDERAVRHAQRKGRIQFKEAALHRLTKYIAPAQPVRDGRQTRLEGNAIYYVRHATATCCRTCLEYWHNIPKGRELTAKEQEYCSGLMDCFIDDWMPELADLPNKVPNRCQAPPPIQ